MNQQSTNKIFLIKPANFAYNLETSISNAFQNEVNLDEGEIKAKVIAEFEEMANLLHQKGIDVHIIEDTEFPIKPDAVFPNNWISMHADGKVILYPMLAENRRLERRADILDTLKQDFSITEVLDLSAFEKENQILEGTGSIIFDHKNKNAYACLSPRTAKDLFIHLCETLNYTPIYFHSYDQNGKEIYHTNVMMNIGNGYVVICLESISNLKEKQMLIKHFTQTNHQIIDVSQVQLLSFCGNMLELERSNKKNLLVLSQTAFTALNNEQKEDLSKYCELFPINIETIETIGGGSVRCMIAEIFLPKKYVTKAELSLLEEKAKEIALKNSIQEGINSGIVEDFDFKEHLKSLKAKIKSKNSYFDKNTL